VSSTGRGTLLDAFRLAGGGVLEAAVSQRNMRLHLVAAVLVATLGNAFPLGVAEQLALLSSVFVVVAAEVLNTALEAAVDLAGDGPDERARVAKDAGAGFVLVLSVGAAAVFALVVARNWDLLRAQWREAAGVIALGLSLAALSAWLVFPFRRLRWLDWLAALGGAALLVPIALTSKSLVFAGVAGLALAVCALAAFARRPRSASERPEMLSPAAPPPRRPAR
jgi:diacylglycerol kinase (ATP)